MPTTSFGRESALQAEAPGASWAKAGKPAAHRKNDYQHVFHQRNFNRHFNGNEPGGTNIK